MKRFFVISLALIILVVPRAYTAPIQNPQILRAQQLESQGILEEAKKIYESLYRIDKNDQNFWNLITFYERTGDFKAIEDLTLSKLKTHPDYLVAKRYLARSYYLQGERKKAHSVLMGIIGDNWENKTLVRLTANEFVRQSEHNEAISVYTTARNIIKDQSLFSIEMARIYTLREDFLPAIEEYLKSLETVKIVFSSIERLIDRAVEAEITLEELFRPLVAYRMKNPRSILVARLLSGLMYRAGDYGGAYKVLIIPARETGSFSDIWNLAVRLKSDGHIEKALEVFEDYFRYFVKAPNRVNALMESASINAELGRKENAKAVYQILIDDYRGTIHAAYASLRLLELLQDRGSFEGYTKLLNDFASTTNFREVAYEAYMLLGETLMRNGKLDEAKLAFNSAGVKSRDKKEIYAVSVQRAFLRFYEADYEGLVNEIQACVINLPEGEDINDLLTYKVLGMRCSSPGDMRAFREFCQGHFALYRGAIDAAIEDFTAAAEDTSSVVAPYAASALGKLFKSQGNFARAVDWYLYAADASKDTTIHIGAVIEAADIANLELNSRNRAKSLYLEAITAYPGSVYESELRNKLKSVVE